MPVISMVTKVMAGAGIVCIALGWWMRDALPRPGSIRGEIVPDPIQEPLTEFESEPWEIERGGIVYTVSPQFHYQLTGMVVSEFNTSTWWNINHRQWNDHFNVKDICVVWGGNLGSGIYQRMKFWSGTFTCYCQMKDGEHDGWEEFRMDQLSNNHLLPATPAVARAIVGTRRGDQIRLAGYLVEYSHSGGAFRRGTSTTRADTGNGACETIFVTDYQIVAPANRLWHAAYGIGWIMVAFATVTSVVGFFADIHRKHRSMDGIPTYDVLGNREY